MTDATAAERLGVIADQARQYALTMDPAPDRLMAASGLLDAMVGSVAYAALAHDPTPMDGYAALARIVEAACEYPHRDQPWDVTVARGMARLARDVAGDPTADLGEIAASLESMLGLHPHEHPAAAVAP